MKAWALPPMTWPTSRTPVPFDQDYTPVCVYIHTASLGPRSSPSEWPDHPPSCGTSPMTYAPAQNGGSANFPLTFTVCLTPALPQRFISSRNVSVIFIYYFCKVHRLPLRLALAIYWFDCHPFLNIQGKVLCCLPSLSAKQSQPTPQCELKPPVHWV